jgi:hypothetical protein
VPRRTGPGAATAAPPALRTRRAGSTPTGCLPPSVAGERYREFVAAGKNQPSSWEELKSQIYLGSETFVNALQARQISDGDLRARSPPASAGPAPQPLASYEQQYHDRGQGIVQAYASGGCSLKEIGDRFGLYYSRISRIVRGSGEAKGKTPLPTEGAVTPPEAAGRSGAGIDRFN